MQKITIEELRKQVHEMENNEVLTISFGNQEGKHGYGDE